MDFASTDTEAASRYAEWRDKDPFPKIPPALLNSGDLADYVAVTGMIYPFHVEEEKLKPASYEVNLLGKCLYWESGGTAQPVEENIDSSDKSFVLRANSIAFVQLEPRFRLPHYIALRFNLRSTHIYRGLLLGTGPLVDPGFDNHLWVPLHNLTENNYTLRGEEGLVWMEFTKLSPIHRKEPEDIEGTMDRQRYFYDFPEDKNQRGVSEYLHAANPGRSIRTSLKEAMEQLKESAQNSAEHAEAAEEETRKLRNIGVAASLIAVLGLLVAMAEVTLSSRSLVSEVRSELAETRERVRSLEVKLKDREGTQVRQDRRAPRGNGRRN